MACNDFGVQEWMADRVDEALGPRRKEPPSGPPPGPPLGRYLHPGHNILNICSLLWEILVRRLEELLAWPTKKSLLNRFRRAGK